jgi:hypothetical protein
VGKGKTQQQSSRRVTCSRAAPAGNEEQTPEEVIVPRDGDRKRDAEHERPRTEKAHERFENDLLENAIGRVSVKKSAAPSSSSNWTGNFFATMAMNGGGGDAELVDELLVRLRGERGHLAEADRLVGREPRVCVDGGGRVKRGELADAALDGAPERDTRAHVVREEAQVRVEEEDAGAGGGRGHVHGGEEVREVGGDWEIELAREQLPARPGPARRCAT